MPEESTTPDLVQEYLNLAGALKAERVIDLGDRVLVLSRQSGRGKRSGVPLDTEYGDIFTIRDGKIVRWELYMERADALAAAGLEK
jgi:ketosteroid isomerase-like protein